jgi:hypothetical protein
VDLSPLLLGPLGALVAALTAVWVLWRELQAVRVKLETLHAERLEDARKTRGELLALYERVNDEVSELERVSRTLTEIQRGQRTP